MIKKTFILWQSCLFIHITATIGDKSDNGERKIPIEDIGVLIVDHYQISVTHAVLHHLLKTMLPLLRATTTSSYWVVLKFRWAYAAIRKI